MSATAAPVPTPATRRHSTFRARIETLFSSAVATVLGLLPHVLHHVGPLAGAALLAGTAGTLLFGAIGLVAATPFLLRVHRRCGNWRVPGSLLALFAVMFSLSAFVIGPAVSGNGDGATPATTRSEPAPQAVPQKERHEAHH